eukprot:UN01843
MFPNYAEHAWGDETIAPLMDSNGANPLDGAAIAATQFQFGSVSSFDSPVVFNDIYNTPALFPGEKISPLESSNGETDELQQKAIAASQQEFNYEIDKEIIQHNLEQQKEQQRPQNLVSIAVALWAICTPLLACWNFVYTMIFNFALALTLLSFHEGFQGMAKTTANRMSTIIAPIFSFRSMCLLVIISAIVALVCFALSQQGQELFVNLQKRVPVEPGKPKDTVLSTRNGPTSSPTSY